MNDETIEKVRAVRDAFSGAVAEAMATPIPMSVPDGLAVMVDRLWNAMARRGDIIELGFAPDYATPETVDPADLYLSESDVNPADDPPDSIQERMAEVSPDLLDWFRRRAVPAPLIDASTNVCGRCGLVVGADAVETHLGWHESLTIAMDALAGLCIVARERMQ